MGIVARLAHSVVRRRDPVPFNMVALTSATAFGTLAVSFWRYMIPFSLTIGTNQGLADPVVMSRAPGSFRTALVLRGASTRMADAVRVASPKRSR